MQVGWGTITAKISQSITPDLDNPTAAGLAASLLVQVVLMTIKLSSRANPAPGVHMCPSELGRPIPVQNTTSGSHRHNSRPRRGMCPSPGVCH